MLLRPSTGSGVYIYIYILFEVAGFYSLLVSEVVGFYFLLVSINRLSDV